MSSLSSDADTRLVLHPAAHREAGPATRPQPGAAAHPAAEEIGRPDLSVIVVTHNRPQMALRTLRTAAAAGEDLRMEWIVIDSGSTDGTPEMLQRAFPKVRLLRERNVGFAAASNIGLRLAHGRWLLLLNPDVEIVSGTFATLLRTLDAQPAIGAASVVQRSPDGRLLHSIRRFPSPSRAFAEALAPACWSPLRPWREEVGSSEAYRRQTPADWLVGAFLLVRAQTLAEVGLLDERFFLYSEEADWCRRIVRAGWRVEHLPAMTVIHHTEQGVSRPQLWAQLSWAKVLFARKHLSPAGASSIRVALALRHALRAAAAGVQRSSAASARARSERHALAVVLGLAPPPFAMPRRTGPCTCLRAGAGAPSHTDPPAATEVPG